MAEQRHIIKRQVVELHVSSSADATHLQTEMSRIYRQRIVPLLGRECTALSAPDRIHRIELDLGTIEREQFEETIVARIGAMFRPLLARHI
ncbi:hypothetical protein C2W62_31250 [Candidatus Entotheonella serta]|nr:hypothetical protein C2W62_31250 [Candidatus Entotheonella serta]